MPNLQPSRHLPSAGASRQPQSRVDQKRWHEGLPPEWAAMAIAPLDFRHYREYEMAAERVLGSDEDGAYCYTAYSFRLTEARCDDGEEFYLETVYGETLCAWKLRDERWLIRRVIVRGEDFRHARAFYSFSDTMPR